MLQQRESQAPALLLALILITSFTYFLLGKWKEALNRRERIRKLADSVAEESLRVEETTSLNAASSPAYSSFNGSLTCARCFSPATTRCSRCKSVRYWYGLPVLSFFF
ncbi:hypothetical protein AMTR_s00096p00169340 [Amborella trichopoda]|uniref:Uncharacterized protein n=1 Tax=Amborella trichopoda TaxID=13333 RepID=W1NXU8_AMBTC|nr:hypothetical protein AMTR_s00096p00169340 [Amborella trichopoda]